MTKPIQWRYLGIKSEGTILMRKEPGRSGRYIIRQRVTLDEDTLSGLAGQLSVYEWSDLPRIDAEEETDYGDTYTKLVAYGSRYATDSETEEIVEAIKKADADAKAAKDLVEARERAELARLKELYPE